MGRSETNDKEKKEKNLESEKRKIKVNKQVKSNKTYSKSGSKEVFRSKVRKDGRKGYTYRGRKGK